MRKVKGIFKGKESDSAGLWCIWSCLSFQFNCSGMEINLNHCTKPFFEGVIVKKAF